MERWKQETSVAFLEEALSQIDGLSDKERLGAEHTRWLLNSRTFLEEVFGHNSSFFKAFAALPWASTGQHVLVDQELFDMERAMEKHHKRAYRSNLEMARGILQSALDQLKTGGFESFKRKRENPEQANLLLRLLNGVQHKLRKMIRTPPDKEVEVQDAFENLLVGMDIQYRREQDTIAYSTKKYIPDFTVAELSLAVEIKLCPDEQREAKLIAEINDDILAYGSQYRAVLFVIYDCGHIRDIERFTSSFETQENVTIRIVKH